MKYLGLCNTQLGIICGETLPEEHDIFVESGSRNDWSMHVWDDLLLTHENDANVNTDNPNPTLVNPEPLLIRQAFVRTDFHFFQISHFSYLINRQFFIRHKLP